MKAGVGEVVAVGLSVGVGVFTIMVGAGALTGAVIAFGLHATIIIDRMTTI